MPRSRELAELATSYDSGGSLGFRNRIINGDCRIDQRNNGASVTATTAAPYTLDRWLAYSTPTSKFTVQQNAGSVTPPAGYTNYLGAVSSSAYSLGTSDVFVINQNIEGFNIADLGWGTANAQTVTLSFWVRSSLTGTFGGVLRNSADTRSYPFTYSISSANTWEQKSITIAGDTTGTWLTNNGVGIRVSFGLGVGSSLSGTAGAWAGALFQGATGATSVVGTNGATWYITGVQLEAGSVATPFERRDYGRELIMAQRYFYNIASGTSKPIGMGSYETATRLGFILYLPVTMRASPTIVQTTGTNYYYIYRNSAYDGFNSWNLDVATTNTVYFQNSSDVSGTVGQTGYISTDNASTYLSVSAEL
jgi:hypothetical protein